MEPRRTGPFPYVPITQRPKLTWPGGARVALWVIPNIEFFSLQEKVPAAAGGSGAPVPDQKLYDTIVEIQYGAAPDPHGWTVEI